MISEHDVYNIKQVALALGGAAVIAVGFAGCSGSSSTVTAPGDVAQSKMSRVLPGSMSLQRLAGVINPLAVSAGGVTRRRTGWVSQEAKDRSIVKAYVSDNNANAVQVFKEKKPLSPIETITSGISGPLGSAVDSHGNLYVANGVGSTVTVYPPGQDVPSETYSVAVPDDVAVGKDGTVYVVSYSQNLVTEFDKGQFTPSRTLSINEPVGAALDAKNNLYVSFYNSPDGTYVGDVQKYGPKSTTGTDLGIAIGAPGMLLIDKHSDLLLADQTAGQVDFFKPGAQTPYGSLQGFYDVYSIALNPKEGRLLIANVL
jgi:hypothetical protein